MAASRAGALSAGGERSYPVSEVRVAAERSYPASKVSGGREETPRVGGQGRRPGGAILCPRSVLAGTRHPASEVRGGWEKPPRTRGQGR